jgi:membrane-associated protease RseP (regulator of RpoE activity)
VEHYRERLSVPVRWWIIAAAAVITLYVIVAVPAGVGAGIAVAGIAAVLLITLFIRYGGAVVAVDSEKLRAGRAVIERVYLGKAEPLAGEAVRTAFGRDCDPAAYLVLRSYVRGAVRVEITDPLDPAPYWLIATRNPDRLAAALTADSVARS